MTKSELLAKFDEMVKEARALMLRKNNDYADEADALFNLKRGGAYGVAIRMDDKVSRLITLSRHGRAALNESEADTCLDLINYAVLHTAVRLDEAKGKK